MHTLPPPTLIWAGTTRHVLRLLKFCESARISPFRPMQSKSHSRIRMILSIFWTASRKQGCQSETSSLRSPPVGAVHSWDLAGLLSGRGGALADMLGTGPD